MPNTKPAAHPFAPDDIEVEVSLESRSPFGQALGIYYIGFSKNKFFSGMVQKDRLLGNKKYGILHGGAITTMIDETSGLACRLVSNPDSITATIDLRVDYMRPANRDEDLFCVGECYRMTKRVCFTRAIVYQNNLDRPVAHGVGSFMIGAYDKRPFDKGTLASLVHNYREQNK